MNAVFMRSPSILDVRREQFFAQNCTYHPQASIEKMTRGIPLNDDDREGWLAALATLIDDNRRQDRSLLVDCSALKHKYRAQRRNGDPALGFLFLDGS